jgi:hypothetical protein
MGTSGFQPEIAASYIKLAGQIRRIPSTGKARRVTDGRSAAGPLKWALAIIVIAVALSCWWNS